MTHSQAPEGTSRAVSGALRPARLGARVAVALAAGALGLMAVPLAPSAAEARSASDARAVALVARLRECRAALQAYRDDHAVFPGYAPGHAGLCVHGPIDALAFERQLAQPSDVWGRTAPAAFTGYAFGPYLPEGLPANPLNGLASTRLLADGERFSAEADGSTGWVFQPASGELRANARGALPGSTASVWEL